jgi:hypothetical protein
VLVARVDPQAVRGGPQESEGAGEGFLRAHVRARVRVVIEAVEVVLGHGGAEGQRVVDERAGHARVEGAPVAVAHVHAGAALPFEARTARDDVDRPAEGVATVEQGLGALDDFHALHVQQARVQGRRAPGNAEVLRRRVDVVDENGHAGTAALVLHAAHRRTRVLHEAADVVGHARAGACRCR